MTSAEKLTNAIMKRVKASDPVDATEALVYVLSSVVFANVVALGANREEQMEAIRTGAHEHLDGLLDIVAILSNRKETIQ